MLQVSKTKRVKILSAICGWHRRVQTVNKNQNNEFYKLKYL